ncbi:PQQ-binding-like beta-propeller repeat protein [Halomonas sp. ISL-60]|uniref:outer membrane protein assembly factor BamB family protein n=1 Tax=Halomonas sp. ISL-56 TaxID=2819149 RepID=UPI001BEA625E|nr:PQQ-binding-like beta-propeller repeat protein [Halomonas sp. ISL-56]MBT2773367.1 PQQ-binding-like beta-propeller repeat protein [Halomonas sp. ISL-60]MBT2803665.1 PQQ-binding-like beta-propeller repeat protein [Halomonas sp. ISL-56]
MFKKNTYTALMATFFCWPLLASGVENQRKEPSINWVFEAPSTYTKDEFLSVGLSGDGNPIQSPMIVSDGMVFFSTYEGTLYAVDEHDGSLKWSSDIFDETGRNIALYENLVFFGEGVVTDSSRPYGSKIAALNKHTGEEVWSFTADDFSGIWGITTHASNVIFSTGNEIYAFDALSGEERWQFSPVDFWGGLSSKDGLVYFQERNTDVYALDAESGEVVFSHKSDIEADYNPRGAAIALHEDNLIFTSGSREEPFLYSYHIDGTKNWETPLDGISLSSVVVDECCIFLGTENGYETSFHALDVNSGKSIWSRDNDGFVRLTPLIHGGRVYFSHVGDGVVAIHKGDGQLAWSFDIEGAVFTPIVSSSNGLLFGTFEGAVYSIKEP